jgi:O-antigen ligase
LGKTSNIDIRLEKIHLGLELFSEAPFLGKGAGRYLESRIDALESALHNTYLEHLVSFGLILGLPLIIGLVLLPWAILSGELKPLRHSAIGQAAAAGIVVYLLVAANQTSNEAAMPRIAFHIYVGLTVALLMASRREGLKNVNRRSKIEPRHTPYV